MSELQRYRASVHVSGFLIVEVSARSVEEAKVKIRQLNLSKEETGNVESVVFNEFESEPEVTA